MIHFFIPLVIGFVGTILPYSAQAALSGCAFPLTVSPYHDWKEYETPHFRVHFPRELQKIALDAGQYLEEAHALLSPWMRWQPGYRTPVMILDDSDLANGLDAANCRLGMVLWVTPPDSWSSIGYYDNWLRMLILHEYTHHLNMDPTRGAWEVLRWLFGDIVRPNSLWTTWMLEGLAVYTETRYTRAGRGRSPYYEMILRAAVEEDKLDDPSFITLDMLAGSDPYFPGGQAPYFFGYHLINHVALQHGKRQLTEDREEAIDSPEDIFGIMSRRSAGRVPFLIDDNLENITGKTWHQTWDDWVTETQRRKKAELERIRARGPLTPSEPITRHGYQALGVAISPDGRRAVYTRSSQDDRSALYSFDLEKREETRLIDDKLQGVGMSFSPDGRYLLFSAIRRDRIYNLYSDLAVYDFEEHSWTWLTDGLRAKDPDLSWDGQWATFTITETGRIGLARAKVAIDQDGDFSLEASETLFMPRLYEKISNPRFTADGRRIIFSYKRHDAVGEELAALDIESRQVRTLVKNEAMNRFPAPAADGAIYFISDATGIDNIHLIGPDSRSVERVSHFSNGFWLPAIAKSHGARHLYGSTFSTAGWDIARIKIRDLGPKGMERLVPGTPPHPQPPPPRPAVTGPRTNTPSEESVGDYSIFPSIAPRQWSPIPVVPFSTITASGVYLGAEVLGFDDTDRHGYHLALGYDTQIPKADWIASYSNRMLGPTLTAEGGQFTSSRLLFLSDGEIVAYERTVRLGVSASFPIRWTFSTLTPIVRFALERTDTYVVSDGHDHPRSRGDYVPVLLGYLNYDSLRYTEQGITAEAGRQTLLGAAVYFDSGLPIYKGLLADHEPFELWEHAVLTPVVAFSYSTHHSANESPNVEVSGGNGTGLYFMDSLEGPSQHSLSRLSLRGYPGRTFRTRAAGVASLDFETPVFDIDRGLGTSPFYFDKVSALVFGESAYFPSTGYALPSAGGGLRLGIEVLARVELTLGAEYHHGFAERFGGQGEALFYLTGATLGL